MVELGNRRVLAPGRWRWARALGWMAALIVALGFVFAGAIAGLALLLRGIEPAGVRLTQGWPGVAIMAAALAVLVGGYVLAVRWGEARSPSELAPARLLPELVAGLGVGGLLMAATIGSMALLGLVTIRPSTPDAITSALIGTLQSGVSEELIFRLVVFRLLWRAFGAWWALGLSALLFGILHLTNPNASLFAGLCIAFEAGILLAAFYMLTGRIWTSMGVHMGWNFTQGWIFGAAVSGTDGFAGGPLVTMPKAVVADWLDGGGFGPEAALPALVICTAVGLWVLQRAWRRDRFAAA